MEQIRNWSQIIAAIAALLAALSSWHNGSKIETVHQLTNSRMSELLAAVQISSRAEGRAQERDEHRGGAPVKK